MPFRKYKVVSSRNMSVFNGENTYGLILCTLYPVVPPRPPPKNTTLFNTPVKRKGIELCANPLTSRAPQSTPPRPPRRPPPRPRLSRATRPTPTHPQTPLGSRPLSVCRVLVARLRFPPPCLWYPGGGGSPASSPSASRSRWRTQRGPRSSGVSRGESTKASVVTGSRPKPSREAAWESNVGPLLRSPLMGMGKAKERGHSKEQAHENQVVVFRPAGWRCFTRSEGHIDRL